MVETSRDNYIVDWRVCRQDCSDAAKRLTRQPSLEVKYTEISTQNAPLVGRELFLAKTIHRNESNKLACPNHPQGLLIDDHHTGDVICTECGLVLGLSL